MGGMLHALAQNGNDVVVAYMTNGSVAVFDDDVRRHLRFVEMTRAVLTPEAGDAVTGRVAEILQALDAKEPAQVDTAEVQSLKASIRSTEAIAGIEVIGLDASAARFLNLPFYQTGLVRKNPVTQADVDIVLALLDEHSPDHLYVAGDLSDPHGTHRMCYQAIDRALRQHNERFNVSEVAPTSEGRKGNRAHDPRPLVWLYRGAWQEWEIDQADTFLPLSKAELDLKIEAIYKHESQKDRALFPGAYDEREFWQRARDRNVGTAEALDALGLPSFYAVDASYVREMP